MAATYLFIDGAYLRARLKHISKQYQIDLGPLDFDYTLFASRIAQKAFYYDCLPAKGGPKENGADYDRRAEPQRRLFKAIKSLPGYHVVLGEAIRSGGGIVQKGVDIRIAVEMLTHAFRGVIDRVVLFAGDRDFEPLVSALVQQGVYVTIAYHPLSVAEELLDAADERAEYDTARLWDLAMPQFKRRYPAPGVGDRDDRPLSNPNAPLIRTGMFGTQEASLYRDDNLFRCYLSYLDPYANKRYQYFWHPDEAVIMKLLAEKNIEIDWTAA
jgi:uncharacterized LabA/DUF88 family protein